MVDVKRHNFFICGLGTDFVLASDFDAALAREAASKYKAELYDEVWQKATDMGFMNVTMALEQVAALREELAERNAAIELKQRDLIEAQTAVTGWAAKCKAAEQRNAELVALLRVVRDTLWQEDEDAAIFDRIDAALKGAESVASSAAPVVERQPVAVVMATGGPHDREDRVLCELQAELPTVGTKLYAEQPASVAMVPLLAKGFTTLESIGGKYKIVTGFENRDDAWAAYDELCRATIGIDKVKELIPTTAAASNNLHDFANAMIDIALEGGNADGAQIQELAVEHGLLKPEQRTERCGDTCSCAEYADFPVECFRKVKELNQ